MRWTILRYVVLSVAATRKGVLNARTLRGRAATSQCPHGTQRMTITPSSSPESSSLEIVCELCEIGRSSESGRACKKCAAGTYQDIRGATTCNSPTINATCASFLLTGATTETAAAKCRPSGFVVPAILISILVVCAGFFCFCCHLAR